MTDSTLDSFEEIFELDEGTHGLLITGPAGSGKSAAVIELASSAFAQGDTVYLIDVVSDSRRYREVDEHLTGVATTLKGAAEILNRIHLETRDNATSKTPQGLTLIVEDLVPTISPTIVPLVGPVVTPAERAEITRLNELRYAVSTALSRLSRHAQRDSVYLVMSTQAVTERDLERIPRLFDILDGFNHLSLERE